MATQFFSAAEVRKLESWPVEFGRDELVQYFTLTPEDVAWVNKSAWHAREARACRAAVRVALVGVRA